MLPVAADRGVDRKDQSDPTRLGPLLRDRSCEPVLLVHPKLGRDEDSETPGQGSPAPRLLLEEVE